MAGSLYPDYNLTLVTPSEFHRAVSWLLAKTPENRRKQILKIFYSPEILSFSQRNPRHLGSVIGEDGKPRYSVARGVLRHPLGVIIVLHELSHLTRSVDQHGNFSQEARQRRSDPEERVLEEARAVADEYLLIHQLFSDHIKTGEPYRLLAPWFTDEETAQLVKVGFTNAAENDFSVKFSTIDRLLDHKKVKGDNGLDQLLERCTDILVDVVLVSQLNDAAKSTRDDYIRNRINDSFYTKLEGEESDRLVDRVMQRLNTTVGPHP